jgi:3-deoxy-D-manno-octulosonic-acid transferase
MLYDIGFLIFSVIYLPVLVFKGKLHREFPERFGRYALAKEKILLSGRDRIWIQAVSVGEVFVCKSLIPLLREKFPGHDLVVSTITKAGNDLAKKLFSKDAVIIYFPLDFGFTVRRAIKYIKPGIYIMIETEIWPNLLGELSLNSIPSVMINGRISDRSIGKYRLVLPFLKKTLSEISAFCMQDTIDAERVISLGAPPDRVKVTGNMKFDVEVLDNGRAPDVVRRSLSLSGDDPLLVAGSTHEGEEEAIVEAFKELIPDFPKLKLLIAPRHIDRVKEIEKIIKKTGFEPVRVSRLNDSRITIHDSQILILDTIGHLNEAYSAATLVFVGGSLVKHGGQNPLEPAVLGRAMLFGPHMFNFRYITKILLKEGAALQIAGKEDLARNLKMLLNDPLKRSELGDNAKRAIAQNRGATKKNLEKISEILK